MSNLNGSLLRSQWYYVSTYLHFLFFSNFCFRGKILILNAPDHGHCSGIFSFPRLICCLKNKDDNSSAVSRPLPLILVGQLLLVNIIKENSLSRSNLSNGGLSSGNVIRITYYSDTV